MIVLLIIIILLLSIFIWGYSISFISLFKRNKENKEIIKKDFSFTCIVCAHNEEKTINNVLTDLTCQNYKNKDIYVVLDNCTDNTYNVVKKYKDIKIINKTTKSTCKGDALNYAYDYLNNNDKLQDIIVIFDADCKVDNNLLYLLNKKYKTGSNAVMVNTSVLNPYDNIISVWYLFYWCMVSILSRLGHSKLNLSCNISGCGISFKKEYYFKTKTITEDVEYFYVLSSKNIKIDYLNNASTYQEQPITFKTMFYQLYRWMNGVIKVNKLYRKEYLKSLIKDFNIIKYDAFITSQTCTSLGLLVLLFIIMTISSIFIKEISLYLIIISLIYIILCLITTLSLTISSKLSLKKVYKGALTYFIFLLIMGLIYDYSLIKPSNKWIAIKRK